MQYSKWAFYPFCILGRDTDVKVSMILTFMEPINESKESATIWVPNMITISVKRDLSFNVTTYICGLMRIELAQTANLLEKIVPVLAIHEVCQNFLLGILMTNVSEKPVELCTCPNTRFGAGAQSFILKPERNNRLNLSTKSIAVHLKVEDFPKPKEHRVMVEHKDTG